MNLRLQIARDQADAWLGNERFWAWFRAYACRQSDGYPVEDV